MRGDSGRIHGLTYRIGRHMPGQRVHMGFVQESSVRFRGSCCDGPLHEAAVVPTFPLASSAKPRGIDDSVCEQQGAQLCLQVTAVKGNSCIIKILSSSKGKCLVWHWSAPC